jgi:hypothetical protein
MYRYANIIKTIRSIAPQAHLAGGAVRDTILEKEIRDIDMFVDDDHVDEVAKLLRTDFSCVKTGEWRQYELFSDPAMTRVAKFENARETIPVCIIGLKSEYASPKANISRFDFGLCMAAFDGSKVIRTHEFDSDMDGETFTLCRADNFQQFAYSMSRFKKISAERYQGWTISIPSDFEEYLKEYELRRRWYVDFESKGFGGENILKPKERVPA